ncbi:MAG: hypothetical protein ACO2Y9_08125 [Pseudohongiellaceae bacterium]
MSRLISLTQLALLLTLVGCTDPLISVPGGKLNGEPTAAPASWSSVPDVIQLETRPDDPYSVNIWALVESGNLYLATENARWLAHIKADDRVRVRIDGMLYALRAEQVTEVEEMNRLAAAYKEKYEYEIESTSFASANAFRLVAR